MKVYEEKKKTIERESLLERSEGKSYLNAATEKVNVSANGISISSNDMINNDILNQGLLCRLKLFLYRYQREYLNTYTEYLSEQKNVYEQLYAAGEITKDVVLESTAQFADCMAQKTVLENEERYCLLYLEEYHLNFDNFDIEKEKNIHDQAYYDTVYTGTARVLIARYIADFQNAKALLSAKETEIEARREKVRVKNILCEAGEITELEQVQEEVLLKKAEYEKAQYIVNMNEAYFIWKM